MIASISKCRSKPPAMCARVLVVHALEMIESCSILRQALSTLPEGPIPHHSAHCRALQGSRRDRRQPRRSAARRGVLPDYVEWDGYSPARPRPHAYFYEHGHRALYRARPGTRRFATHSGIVRPLLFLHRSLSAYSVFGEQWTGRVVLSLPPWRQKTKTPRGWGTRHRPSLPTGTGS